LPAAANPRSIREIREAIELFEAWEASINHADAAKRFTEAMQLLGDYLDYEPDSSHRQFVKNLRLSNTRRLLQQLAKVDRKDFGLWLEYALAVMAVVDQEAAPVIAANPELKADLDAFLKVWGESVNQALQRIQHGQG
jgi:hypothetical protein